MTPPHLEAQVRARPAESSAGNTWYDWLLTGRYGGDDAYRAALQPIIDDIRDRVLDHARLAAGQDVADIGSGDGMVGFAALDREPQSRLTFIDSSPELIAYTRAAAERRQCAGRCRFIIASAEALDCVDDASIDVITVRAVLAYVADRTAAVREFARILRPGGRISIVDPIFQDRAFALAGIASQLRSNAADPAARYVDLLHRWRSAQWPDTVEAIARDPLTNYNERDLLRLLEGAGFTDIHLRLHIDTVAALPTPWHVFLATSPRAGILTNGAILGERFTAAERLEFEALFRSGIEAGSSIERNVNAYLFADRA